AGRAEAVGKGGRVACQDARCQESGGDQRFARHQILSALNGVPRTDTTGAVGQTLYLQLLPEDTITYCPALHASLATALGREVHPESAVAAASERNRLQAFLQKREGAALMLTGTEERRQASLVHVKNITSRWKLLNITAGPG